MRLATTIRYLYLSYFSKPVGDRPVYRAIRRTQPRKILEIGIAATDRTLRMLDFAGRLIEDEVPKYTAIDLFEARSGEAPKLSLKEAHRLLKSAGVQPQLVPGDPASALARVANSLPDVDLVLISAAHDDASLAGAWFYLPRMLHANSLVLREVVGTPGEPSTFQEVTNEQIRVLGGANRRRAA